MEIKINLSKQNKKLLKTLTLNLFSKVKKVKFKKTNIILNYGFLKRSHKLNIIDLVLLYLPKELNDYSNYLQYGEQFPYFENIDEAVEYFSNCDDIIKELYSTYSSLKLITKLNNNIDSNIIEKHDVNIVECKRTKKNLVQNIYSIEKQIDEVINNIERPLKVVYISSSLATRGPPREHTIQLRDTG